MSPPPAAKNFKQYQPITTALRQICESYPAASCLRELLQNADDAGATEIEYVLDTSTYSDKPLICEELEQYHGPALLARNNSLFTDKDFSSLSSIGDSQKRHNVESTGKFGQGFNSCYHWTDGPWVYSRNWLLLLDPHESWSVNIGSPGGPMWDVVGQAGSKEVQNHIKTFQAFNFDPSVAFDGTIIRIPLRTKAQAEKSKIVDREVTTNQISEALSLLGHEVKQGGLLFLKHVRKMSVRVDNRVLWQVEMQGHDTASIGARNNLSIDFKALFVPVAPTESNDSVSRTFQVDIRFTEGALDTTFSYLIHHLMKRSSENPELDSWARGKKLFSWVAIAAPISGISSSDPFRGRLFSVLRLPIETSQPVHIHGLFSITPDRGRLSSSGQTPGYEDMETKWNDHMFGTCVAQAWASLLVTRSVDSWRAEGFALWPRIESAPTAVWTKLDDLVLGITLRDDLPVWKPSSRCVRMTEAFFDTGTGDIVKTYGPSLASIRLPAVYPSSSLLRKLKLLAARYGRTPRFISPKEVRLYLTRPAGHEYMPSEYTQTLLRYCLLDAINKEINNAAKTMVYTEIAGLKLWPMIDGSCSSLDKNCLLLPRDNDEMLLFQTTRSNETLDLGQLHDAVVTLIREDVGKTSQPQGSVITLIREDVAKPTLKAIRLRGLDDLSVDWSFMYPLPAIDQPEQTSMPRSGAHNKMLNQIWKWICLRYKDEKVIPLSLQKLWLLPTLGSHVRQLASKDRALPVLVVQKDEALYRILTTAWDTKKVAEAQILECDVLPVASVKLLRAQVVSKSSVSVASSDHLETLLPWLVSNKERFGGLQDPQKGALLHELAALMLKATPSTNNPSWRLAIAGGIRQLPLFNCMNPDALCQRWATARTSLDSQPIAVIAPKLLPAVPLPLGFALFQFSTKDEKDVQKTLALLEDMALATLLFEHLIPCAFQVHDPEVQNSGLENARYALADFTLENSRNPSAAWIDLVGGASIIPLDLAPDGQRQYRWLRELVDPSSALAKLYLEDEDVYPERQFFQKHSPSLVKCGIKTEIAWDTPLHRVRCYANRTDLGQVLKRVQQLLAMPVDSKLASNETVTNEIRNLKWLPCVSLGEERLRPLSPGECRGADERDFVDLALAVLDLQVPSPWKKLFGWHQPIGIETLHCQLDRCLVEDRYTQIDQVLDYVYQYWGSSSLRSKRYIFGSRGTYLHPDQACLPNSMLHRFPLAPYLEEVDMTFASKHSNLLSDLGVLREPALDDVLMIQQTLAHKNQGLLQEAADMDVMVSLLEIASRLPEAGQNLARIMVPDTEQILRFRSEVVSGDRSLAINMPDVRFTHPSLSSELVRGLQIESPAQRATRLHIEVHDDEDDEYVPQEQLTTIIADTLRRYPVESTFGELLANAEDCRASEIAWILDTCEKERYASTLLLSPNMSILQGPSLFAWNDQVFSAEDFKGYKDIGRGGKSEDDTSIGRFGRGSMTMYHFTDSPMILSGGYLLMLDPQQRLLTPKRDGTRRIGVKLSLDAVRRICPDQLAPFDGLCSYTKDMNHYQGTIFRMPLKSDLSAPKSIDAAQIERLFLEYYALGKESLLFLRHIKNISFSFRGAVQPLWSISADRPQSFDIEVYQQVEILGSCKGLRDFAETWRVGLTKTEPITPDSSVPYSGAPKITECGVAACLRHEKVKQELTEEWQDKPKTKFYCKLPTAYASELPVAVHASFSVTGDRRTVSVEDERDPNTAWNRWLLQECIPEFYINFLKDLGPRIGVSTFDYWPSASPLSSSPLSRYVYTSFWEKIREQKYNEYPLYPLVEVGPSSSYTFPLNSRASSGRKQHEVTSSKSAQFDLLPEEKSAFLRPLLCSWNPRLVRPPPSLIRQFSKTMISQVTVLDAAYLCQLLKDGGNRAHLDRFLTNLNGENARARALEMLLLEIVPETMGADSPHVKALNGCHVLPLRDGSLKLLSWVAEKTSMAEWTIIPDGIEREVFNFAQDALVDYRLFNGDPNPEAIPALHNLPRRNPFQQLKEASFNIRAMPLSDVGRLLDRSDSPLGSPDQSPPKEPWFSQFWNYMNQKAMDVNQQSSDHKTMVNDFLKKCGVQQCPIYRTRASKAWRYITPDQLLVQPCVIEPTDQNQTRLCNEIEELRIIDRTHILFPMAVAEKTLNDTPSMFRLMRGLAEIDKQSRRPIKASLQSELSIQSVELLRDLLTGSASGMLQCKDFPVLSELPGWPRQTKIVTTGLSLSLAAKDATFCKTSALLTPWTQGCNHFIDPDFVMNHESTFLTMGFQIEDCAKTWADRIERFLPSTLGLDHFDQFNRMIGCLASSTIGTTAQVVPNGRGYLRRANQLFDDQESVFCAAFRDQQQQLERFVHPKFRNLRSHWVSLGLRSRSSGDAITWEDYLECVRAIDTRCQRVPKDTDFAVDALMVASYLSYEKPTFHSWSDQTWNQIARIRMFEVETTVAQNGTYRQARMRELSQRSTHCSLQEAGNGSYKRLLWSQQPLLKQPPAGYIYQRLPQCGNPSVSTVHAHLLYLMQMRHVIGQVDVAEFLKDTQDCYSFLQDNMPSVVAINRIRKSEIWLNIGTTDADSVTLEQIAIPPLSAEQLCINSPSDPAPYMNALKFLIPYEKLLKGLGVHAVVMRNRSLRITNDNDVPPSEHLASNLRRLRDDGKMLDVTFQAEGLDISAHKVCMAAVSSYCEAQLSGPWGRLQSEQPTIVIQDLKASTLKHIVDFAYGLTVVWPHLPAEPSNDQIADRVDDLLDLLQGTDMWLMKELHSVTEQYFVDHFNVLVRPDNVERVKEEASAGNAHHLEKTCADYIEDNLTFVTMFRD